MSLSSPFLSYHTLIPFHYHACSRQLYHHFGEINFSAYIIWMMYMLLQLDNTVQYDFLPFPFAFPFYFSLYLLLVCCQTLPQLLAERRSEHITLWDISIKALCCVPNWCNCFTDWTPCFPLPCLDHFGGIPLPTAF